MTSFPIVPGDKALPGTGPWGQVGQRFHDAGINEARTTACYSGQRRCCLGRRPGTVLSVPKPLAPATRPSPHPGEGGLRQDPAHICCSAALCGGSWAPSTSNFNLCHQFHDKGDPSSRLCALAVSRLSQEPQGGAFKSGGQEGPFALTPEGDCVGSLPYPPPGKAASLSKLASVIQGERSQAGTHSPGTAPGPSLPPPLGLHPHPLWRLPDASQAWWALIPEVPVR